MKAVIYTKYGSPDVLRLEEVPRPVPGDNDVLVEVRASSINAYDWHMLRADPFLIRFMGGGVLKPKRCVIGVDLAGRVEAVGGNVTRFHPGDEVFGEISGGAFAEYVCVRENALTMKPAGVSFEKAAAVPLASITALQGLRDKGHIRSGQKVLINGASGGVGTFAVQIAKSYGTEVTAVCSTRNLDMVRTIGADHVIDYTQEDFTATGQHYDLILSCNGSHPISHYKRALNPGGTFVLAGGTMGQFFRFLMLSSLLSMTGGKNLVGYVTKPNLEDLVFVSELLGAGKIKPVIDRRYSLSEVPDAIRYIENEHARGKVVITV